MGQLYEELKRRKVFRVAAAYAVVAWVLIQISGEVLPALQMPEWTVSFITVLLLLGFPVALLLGWAFDLTPDGVKVDTGEQLVHSPSNSTDRKLTYAILVLVLLVAGFQFADRFMDNSVAGRLGPDESRNILRSSISIGEIEYRPIPRLRNDLAISPDGTLLAYTARKNGLIDLYLRKLSESEHTKLVDAEDAGVYPIAPAFSPNGDEILYFRFGSSDLVAVSIDGANSRVVTSAAESGLGGNWISDETIVFTHNADRNLHTVSVNGGSSTPISVLADANEMHSWPELYPGGEWVLYTATDSYDFNQGRIEAVNLATKEVKVILRQGYNGRYADSGHIVFMRYGDLWGVPLDEESLSTTGSEFRIEPDIENFSVNFGKAAYTFSENGQFVYLKGDDGATATGSDIIWQQLNDESSLIPHELPENLYQPIFSPDGQNIAFTLNRPGSNSDIAIYSVNDGYTAKRTFSGNAGFPIWSRGGFQIAYTEQDGEMWGLWIVNADGSGNAQQLLESTEFVTSSSFAPDGSTLIYMQGTTNARMMSLSLESTDLPILDISESMGLTRGGGGKISPDGNWLAYTSTESALADLASDFDVFVRPFPQVAEGRWQLSYNSGIEPVWGVDSNEVYFLNWDDNFVYRIPIITEPGFIPGRAERIAGPIAWNENIVRNYALSPDGQQIIYRKISASENPFGPQLTLLGLVENWFDLLRELDTSIEN